MDRLINGVHANGSNHSIPGNVHDADTIDSPAAAPPTHEQSPKLPTHRITNMKAGDDSVQLLVSTENHLYDIKGCESGKSAWQSVGVWSDDVVVKVTDIIRERQPTGGPSAAARDAKPGSTADMGPGRRLGA